MADAPDPDLERWIASCRESHALQQNLDRQPRRRLSVREARTLRIAGRMVRVEHGIIAPRRVAPSTAPDVPPPAPIGPVAADAGWLLRHRPRRWPAEIMAGEDR